LPLVSMTPVANLPLVSLTPVVHLDLQISLRIFEKIWNDPIIIFRGLGEGDSWKKPKAKISWHCHFKSLSKDLQGTGTPDSQVTDLTKRSFIWTDSQDPLKKASLMIRSHIGWHHMMLVVN
jgi:hypothetical protein